MTQMESDIWVQAKVFGTSGRKQRDWKKVYARLSARKICIYMDGHDREFRLCVCVFCNILFTIFMFSSIISITGSYD
jgi:hypothetical protein